MKAAPKALPLKPTNKFEMPFKAWSIDYMPTLPATVEGYQHLMICVDVFSKWVELIPMRSKNSGEVSEALKLYIIARFGVPQEFRVDRGLEFAGSVT